MASDCVGPQVLESTTDTRYCLAEIPIGQTALATAPEPHWTGGEQLLTNPRAELTSPVPAPSVLVHRPKTHRGRGAVSSAMTYLPGRYLRGLLPEALLRCYEFWQHSDGAIEGEARGAAAAAAAATAKKKRNPSATGGNADAAAALEEQKNAGANENGGGWCGCGGGGGVTESEFLVLLTDAKEAVVRRIPLATDCEPIDDEARRLLTHLQDAPGTALCQLISLLWSSRERDCKGWVCLIRLIARLQDCEIARGCSVLAVVLRRIAIDCRRPPLISSNCHPNASDCL